MSILLYLIPIALTLGLLALAGFLWTIKNNQYEDLDGAAHRILIDDELPPPFETLKENQSPIKDNTHKT